MERIHNNNNRENFTKKGDLFTKKGDRITKKGDLFTKNSHPEELEDQNDNTEEHRCPMCDKVFTRAWYVEKHVENCNGGKNIYECEYCKTEFSHKKSRFHHYKRCKVKQELDAKALIKVEDTEQVPTVTSNTQSVHNQSVNNHNSTIENQNNIQTQQNIIIMYNGENTQFKTHHIDDATIQRILRLAHPEINRKVVTEYTKEILSLPENRCVKKEDLKAGHSEIHMGDNEWDVDLDRNIYPKLACSAANNMSEYLYTKKDQLRKEVFDKLISFVDYMTDEGYANIDDKEKEKQILEEYKLFVKELRLMIYSRTRKKKSS